MIIKGLAKQTGKKNLKKSKFITQSGNVTPP